MRLKNYVLGDWHEARSGFTEIRSAIDDRVVACASSEGLDLGAVVAYARGRGGPALRTMTFAARAAILRDLAKALFERKAEFAELSFDTGSTASDHRFDVDGGIGTLAAYASKARRELPDETFLLDGGYEGLSKRGTFGARHYLVPRRGVAGFINAYNFPCWGLLEKFAPAFLAGVPVIAKPATATAYVTHALVAAIVETGLLPEGALQLIAGSARDLLDHLDGQDLVSFTGSLETSLTLRAHPAIARESVRFIAERDSLNAAVLGPDAVAGTPEFDLFVRETVREMTVKAGQKCTAIRRAFVPRAQYAAAASALREKLGSIVVGDPRRDDAGMGALVSREQRANVRDAVARLAAECQVIYGDATDASRDREPGAFFAPVLLGTTSPRDARAMHDVEAFGPVATLAAYDELDDAIALVNRGGGSLVASIYTYDDALADALAFGIGAHHGRIVAIDRDCAAESTGHGAPPPALVHGGPGRAGGGEELGGLRALHHFLQRVAIQGSPRRLTALGREWIAGAEEIAEPAHPFRATYEELQIGRTLRTAARTITLDDIERFAHFTGDTFYAHMDEEAAKANPFFGGRVAHGYLLLAFAAGLFVDPAPGPVLANYGLDSLRFSKPVKPGDSISVRLTVKSKAPRKPEYGEVRWDVELRNQDDDIVASYDLLTMNARVSAAQANGHASKPAAEAGLATQHV